MIGTENLPFQYAILVFGRDDVQNCRSFSEHFFSSLNANPWQTIIRRFPLRRFRPSARLLTGQG